MFIIFLGRDYPALFQLGHARFAQQSRRRGGQRGSSAEGGLRTAANTRAGQSAFPHPPAVPAGSGSVGPGGSGGAGAISGRRRREGGG